jgi:hypothetical protein
MNKDLKFFKLTYSGNFTELPEENLIDNFNLYNIIAIYSPFKKTLFVWIGKKAAQSLKGHIATIRHTFSAEYPEMYILRNITIESGSEPDNFFEMMEIDGTRLEKKLKTQESKSLPVFSEINRLKENADKLFIEENFDKAIEVSQTVQNLAREVNDVTLVNDQQSFIEEARIKNKALSIFNEIKKEANIINRKINSLNKDSEYLEIYDLISGFLTKYGEYNIEEIQSVQDMISVFQEVKKRSEDKKNKIVGVLKELDIDFNESLNQFNLEKAKIQISKAHDLLRIVKNAKLNLKWNKNEENVKILTGKIKKDIQRKTQSMAKLLEERNVNLSLSILNEIIDNLEKVIKL